MSTASLREAFVARCFGIDVVVVRSWINHEWLVPAGPGLVDAESFARVAAMLSRGDHPGCMACGEPVTAPQDEWCDRCFGVC